MRKAGDTIMRSLTMLQVIPVQPGSKTTREIGEELLAVDPNYQVDIRSIQRSLEKLSAIFPIGSERDGRANRWFWTQKDAITQIPAMSRETAFALKLAGEYLKPIMPPSTLRLMAGHLRAADEMLKGESKLGAWARKARIVERGIAMTPPSVRQDVIEEVYRALLDDQRIEVTSSTPGERATRRVLNPLGVVFRGGIIHLVATEEDEEGDGEVQHFLLHRLSNPTLLAEPVQRPRGFSLSRHIDETEEFSSEPGAAKLKLRAVFQPEAFNQLGDAKLASDHRTTIRRDGRVLVEATVADSAELRTWLMGFGAMVEVLSPKRLRNEFTEHAEALHAAYVS